MRSVILQVLTLASAVLSVTITKPSSSKGWSQDGPQLITWDRSASDPVSNFTILLTNDNGSLPGNSEVLVAFVDATVGDSQVFASPPSAGWPVGGSFHIVFVPAPSEDGEQDTSTVYATSTDFGIGLPDPLNPSSSVSQSKTSTSSSSIVKSSLTVSASSVLSQSQLVSSPALSLTTAAPTTMVSKSTVATSSATASARNAATAFTVSLKLTLACLCAALFVSL